MNLNSQILAETVRISNLGIQVAKMLPVNKILTPDDHSLLINGKQAPNGSLFQVPQGINETNTVTLPDSSTFEHECFRITILSTEEIINVRLFSDFSNDSLTFETQSYSDSSLNFNLYIYGYVELMWKSGGWMVISSYAFAVSA